MRTAFEEWLTFENISVDSVQVGGEEFTPFQVLSHNRETFRNTFLEWRNSIWLPERKQIAAKICDDTENKDRLRQLSERLEAKTIIPFVGAGLSLPSGFKLWAAFLHQLRMHCSPPLSEDALKKILSTRGGYEKAAEKIIQKMPPRLFNERFEGYSRIIEPSDVRGCVRLLPLLCPRNGLTTNFDNVLEVVYSQHKLPFGTVLYGKQMTEWQKSLMLGQTVLLKIHGHATQPESRVLTTSEYAAVYATGCPHRTAMETIVQNSAFLFLGCSLSEDKTMDLMKDVFRTHIDLATRNYAILPMPEDKVVRRKREAFLADRAIFPIWYGDYGESSKDGFDHDLHVESLLVQMLDDQGKIDLLTVGPEEPIQQY